MDDAQGEPVEARREEGDPGLLEQLAYENGGERQDDRGEQGDEHDGEPDDALCPPRLLVQAAAACGGDPPPRQDDVRDEQDREGDGDEFVEQVAGDVVEHLEGEQGAEHQTEDDPCIDASSRRGHATPLLRSLASGFLRNAGIMP